MTKIRVGTMEEAISAIGLIVPFYGGIKKTENLNRKVVRSCNQGLMD